MANEEHLAILKQGVEVWNRWREENPDIQPDLNGAKLSKSNLEGVDLSRAYLSQANLQEGNLSGANLHGANLYGANLYGASLGGANLYGANLHGANLSGAIFNRTNISGTNFSGATLYSTTFSATEMSEAVGLESARHHGPSSIGIDTLFMSQGKIPEPFLRGAGVPEEITRFLPSFFAQPFRFYSCFISHSSRDNLFCERLCYDLRNRNVRVWYFPEDAKWGRTVWGEIDGGINIYDKLVVVLSKNSLKSIPVLREIERALQREEREKKYVLFPIRLDDSFMKWQHERKADVTKTVIGDFTNWQDPASYKKAFDKLLAALQAEDKKKD